MARISLCDWIVKLPDNRYNHVPENEFSMMTWARTAGITVPEVTLVKVADVEGLPEGITLHENLAYAIRRFDRPEPGRRIHMEVMAQVLGLYSDEKYKKYNYETVANIILKVAGLDSFERLARKLELSTDDVLPVVRSAVSATLDTWASLHPDLPLSSESKQRIQAHWKRVPLLQGKP
jgi:serine/threonine-protein kinase HipA